LAVFDGHGTKGKEASELARNEIHNYLLKDKEALQKLSERKEVEKYFHKLSNKIQSQFRKNPIDYDSSGSCGIMVLIIGNQCYIINLGDSRAVIGAVNATSQKVAYQMSIDHKPNRPEEKERIEKNGGFIAIESPNSMGPYRVYSKNDEGPGLAVSRSFGDLFGHTVGVSHIPEVSYKLLDDTDMFIIIGSDGIWDVMNSAEVVGFIFEKIEKEPLWTRQRIVEELVSECRYRWEQINMYKERVLFERTMEDVKLASNTKLGVKKNIDDITAVICFFTIMLDEQK
jgi:integrin-linked kinase-associated serine/threonine phosphatase 2C